MIITNTNSIAADVTDEHMLKTSAVSQPEDKHLNESGNVFSVEFEVTPANANDYFFCLKNNGIKDLFITDIRISSSVITRINYKAVSGTPVFVAQSTAAATNRNLGNSKKLDADIFYDTDITGLTDDGVVFFEKCDTAGKLFHLRTSSNIIIPQGKSIAFQREAATGDIECMVSVVVAE